MSTTEQDLSERLQRLGAWMFTALIIAGGSELLHEGRLAPATVTIEPSYAHENTMARAEGKGEAARMPEEFDVGLQTPHTSGL